MKYTALFLCMASITAFGQAEPVTAIQSGRWESSNVWNRNAVPTAEQKVWVAAQASVVLKGQSEIFQIALGDGTNTGDLIIDGGTLRTRTSEWIAAGYNNSAVLKLMNGGTLITQGRMSIGLKDEIDQSLTEVIVENGSIFVNGILDLGKTFDGVSDAGNRVSSVAILRIMKGRVEARELMISPNGNCRINLAGGTLVLEGDQRALVSEYVADGRMFAHSKAPGAEVVAEYSKGRTTIKAAEAPESLGLLLTGL